MNRWIISVWSAFALFSFAEMGSARDLVIAGPSSGWQQNNDDWRWDGGSHLLPFRQALASSRFGVSGTLPDRLETRDMVVLSRQRLSEVDVFVSPWWRDQDLNDTVENNILDFFMNGGGLILLQDDDQHDRIGEALGIPTLPSDGSPSSGAGPLCEGPFGTATNVLQFGDHGRLDLGDVLSHGGHVGAVNASGQITAAYWYPDEFRVGAGPLVILTDVDMITDLTADYDAPNDNGVFGLNTAAFMISDYHLGGPGESFQTPSGHAWEGGVDMFPHRAALRDTANFGPQGTVKTRLNTKNLDHINPETLARLDGFVVTNVPDADFDRDSLEAIVDFFERGGDLIVFQDSRNSDAVGAMLGLPSITAQSATPSTGTRFLYHGPFGDVGSVDHFGVGALRESDVLARQGRVVGRNATDDVTSAVWRPGEYAPGCGSLVIITDIDSVLDPLAMYFPPDAEARFALNAVAFAIRDYVIGGPSSAWTPGSSSWSWDGGVNIEPFRNAIEDQANFGRHGHVRRSIEARSLSLIDAGSLEELDAFVSTYWLDSDLPDPTVQAIIDFFLGGGDLWLMQDSVTSDKIGDALGIPTSASAGTRSFGVEPLGLGVFGSAFFVDHHGSVGKLETADVLSRNGRVGMRNDLGEVTAAYWQPGEYAPDAGRLIILSDTDLVASTEASYDPLDSNGRFALNTVSFLSCRGSAVPYGTGTPGTGGLVPHLRLYGCVSIGNDVTMVIDELAPVVSGLLFVGFGGRVDIPVAGGQFLVGGPYLTLPFINVGAGLGGGATFRVKIRMPENPDLADLQMNLQAVIFDPGAPSGQGIAMSQGLEAIIGG